MQYGLPPVACVLLRVNMQLVRGVFAEFSRNLNAAYSLLALAGVCADQTACTFDHIRLHPAVTEVRKAAFAAICSICRNEVRCATNSREATHVSIVNPYARKYRIQITDNARTARDLVIEPGTMPVWSCSDIFSVTSEYSADILLLYWTVSETKF